eukprot:951269_1
MEVLVKFRNLADSATEEEFISLIPHIVDIIGGKDKLISILHHHFHSHLHELEERSKLETINQIMSDITDHDDAHALIVAPNSMEQASATTINQIASYLDVKSYARFELANRNVFIAVRSPYNLQDICPWAISRYLRQCRENEIPFDEKKFIRLKHVNWEKNAVRGQDMKLKWDKLKFKKLTSLSLDGSGLRHYSDLKSALTSSMRTQNIALNRVVNLDVKVFDSMTNPFFNSLLQATPNVQILRIHSSVLPPTIESVNHGLLKRVKALSLCHDNGYGDPDNPRHSEWYTHANHILNLCSSELVALDVNSDLTQLNVNHKRFPNLVELSLGNNDLTRCPNLEKWKCLKRISWDLVDQALDCRSRVSLRLSNEAITQLFRLPELREIVFFILGEKVPELLESMANALTLHPKKTLKVYIHQVSQYDTIQNLKVFVNALGAMVSQDFMFVYDAGLNHSQQQQVCNWLDALDKEKYIHEKINLTRRINERDMFVKIVVTNKECKINGYQTQFMINESN